jgi:hypothetical protein
MELINKHFGKTIHKCRNRNVETRKTSPVALERVKSCLPGAAHGSCA